MKTLLVLMLVLCLASAANATLTLTSSEGTVLTTSDTTMIGIYTDTPIPGGGPWCFVIVDEADAAYGSWTGNGGTIYYPPAIATPSVYTYYYGHYSGYGDMWMAQLSAGIQPSGIGVFADFEFQVHGIGPTLITLYTSDLMTVIDTITIYIPEPATIALLGLGGLALIRRKH